jgi:hypothetical protein
MSVCGVIEVAGRVATREDDCPGLFSGDNDALHDGIPSFSQLL